MAGDLRILPAEEGQQESSILDLTQIEESIRKAISAGVHLAIVRGNLVPEDQDEDFTFTEIAEDAANASFGIDTCAGEPVEEVQELMKYLKQLAEAERIGNMLHIECERLSTDLGASRTKAQEFLYRVERAESTLSQIRAIVERLKDYRFEVSALMRDIAKDDPKSPSAAFVAMADAYPELLALAGKE